MCRENPAKFLSLAKNPLKYTTAYIVKELRQMALWAHMFLKLGLNKEKSIHTPLLQALPLQHLHL
jgi:hypothetical protein